MEATGPLPSIRRHLILGLLGGLLFGLGLSTMAFLYGVIALGTMPPILVVLLATVGGGVWGVRGPVRAKGPEPTEGVPEYNERVQQALADNEAAIGQAFVDKPREPTELPDIAPPADGDGVWRGGSAD
jgi:hypothetical protein